MLGITGISRTVDAALPDGAADMAAEPIQRKPAPGEAGYVAREAT
jgi:hypothetical protein